MRVRVGERVPQRDREDREVKTERKSKSEKDRE